MSVKKLLKNRYIQLIVVFICGGIVATFLLPEKIRIEEKEIVVEKEIEVEKEVVKYVDRVIEKEVEVVVHERKVWRKETFPDGHVIEEEIYESVSEQVERIAEQEKQKYHELLAKKEKEFQKKYSYLKEHTNPKPLTMFAGIGVDIPDKVVYYGGMNKPIFGPVTIGGLATSKGTLGLQIGIRF